MTVSHGQRVAVLASGSGTNLQALLDAELPGGQIVVVGADRHKAQALQRARDRGVPTFVTLLRDHADRAAFDRALLAELQAHEVDWVCTAGFMKVLGAEIVDAFPNRILNIHPTLLPSFPGLHPHRQALAHGVRVSGCTVHVVDHGTDTGPIVAQGAVPVWPDDDESALAARVLLMEHRVFPMVLRWAVAGRIAVDGRHAHVDLSGLSAEERVFLFDSP